MKTLPNTVTLDWDKQYRIIPSKYMPINFFEKIVAPHEMEAAFYLESLTNDRLREEAGDLQLIRSEDRISGPGASIIMAAFTHIGKPSRFTDGAYGVYYASKEFKTAILETVYSRAQFLGYTHEAAGTIDMRVYVGKILKPLHDIRDKKQYLHCHDPNDYTPSQALSKILKEQGSFGIVYNSMRHPGGFCVAALRATAISIPKQTQHLAYVWDGAKITRVYAKSDILFEFENAV